MEIRHSLLASTEPGCASVWSREEQGSVRILAVGDVHFTWSPSEDRRAIEWACPDALLFVGDFGEEATDIAKDMADLPFPKAVILGNHDAWYSLYGGGDPDYSGAREQLTSLGADHLAWSAKRFTSARHTPFSVVGARPFSQGGAWDAVAPFYRELYGVASMQESAARLSARIREQPEGEPLIVIAHNGPMGLGSSPESPAGMDFKCDAKGEPIRRDYGDEDLQEALSDATLRRRVALVLFGHMHHRLHPISGCGLRNMAALDPETPTVYLNAAVVPRVEAVRSEAGAELQGRHFLAIEMLNGSVTDANHVWIHVPQDQRQPPHVVKIDALLKSCPSDHDGHASQGRSIYSANSHTWTPITCCSDT